MKVTQNLQMLYRTPKAVTNKGSIAGVRFCEWMLEKGWMQRVLRMELTQKQELQFTGKNPDQEGSCV
jgi:hypothetical protein